MCENEKNLVFLWNLTLSTPMSSVQMTQEQTTGWNLPTVFQKKKIKIIILIAIFGFSMKMHLNEYKSCASCDSTLNFNKMLSKFIISYTRNIVIACKIWILPSNNFDCIQRNLQKKDVVHFRNQNLGKVNLTVKTKIFLKQNLLSVINFILHFCS